MQKLESESEAERKERGKCENESGKVFELANERK
jgi:hypothetical protein